MRQFAIEALAETFRQELLRARANALVTQFEYRRLRALLASPGMSGNLITQIRVESLYVDIAGHDPIRLAGIFLIEFPGLELRGLYLYSSAHGIARVNHRQQMDTYFTDARSREILLVHAGVADRPAIRSEPGALTVRLQEMTGPVFDTQMDAIIALQKRNLWHVLSLPAVSYDQAAVRVDDALDIRGLLDHRLLSLNGSWRWKDESVDFEQVWADSGGRPRVPRGDLPAPSDTWADRVDNLDALVGQLPHLHPGVRACMYGELNRHLALVVETGLDARGLWIGQVGANGLTPLLTFALERISGAEQGDIPDDWVAQRDSPTGQYETVVRLPTGLLNTILRRVCSDFAERYEKQVRRFSTLAWRRVDTQIRPDALSRRVRENALRLEVTIERRLQNVAAAALDMVQQVLDRPQASLREALGAERVDTYAVALSFDLGQAPLFLNNAFVLHNPDIDDRYVMWAVGLGIGDFDSISRIESQILARLSRVDQCEQVLDLLSEADRTKLEDYLANHHSPVVRVILREIEADFFEAQLASEDQRRVLGTLCAYRDATAWRLSHSIFSNLLDAAEYSDINRKILNGLRAAIQTIVDITIVPSWVSEASPLDQAKLLIGLQRFYVACGLQEDFLFNIPTLHDYSRRLVSEKLKTDFPELELDPDSINVTLTHYVAAPVAPGDIPQSLPAATSQAAESLTGFAVNRFYAVQEGTLSVRMADGSAASPLLTPLYLRGMVRSLDVATGYLDLLQAAFTEDNPTYALRQRRFAEQMPTLDVLRAMVLKMQGGLSAEACRLVGAILEMPDGIARLPVGGYHAIISPLLLSPARHGWKPAAVMGTYVIAPAEPNPGPWVLYSLLGDFVFKEYPDKAALLNDIHTSPTLQAYVLERLDKSVRKIYDHGGFQEPHLPFSTESSLDIPLNRPGPVTLRIEPDEGNALELLFKGMVATFMWRIGRKVVTNDQEWKRSSHYLFSLGVEQMLAFMPGRLGALVGIWQSQGLFNASAAAAGERRWGKALTEFTAAVSMLITSRELVHEDPVPSGAPHPVELTPFVEFSWSKGALTPELRSRLRAFEAHDVALKNMRKNELFNTYRDDANGRVYVAVSGAVYELNYDRNRWYIVSDNVRGPAVKLGEDQKWVLDLDTGLRGGGGVVSRIKGSLVDTDANEILMVEAAGMPEIRHVSRAWAEFIEEGHAQARFYLENCLDNLTLRPPLNALDSRAQHIVSEFFSQRTPQAGLYDSIKQAVTKLYEELMHPSLSPIDSQRYVVGTNRRGHEPSNAFTFDRDPFKRIYLTERFFRPPVFRLKTRVQRAGSFNYASHYHAAILIHELSHQVLNTDDIAYVDSFAPFLDLLEDTPGYRLRVKTEQVAQQQKILSYNTDRSQLFKQLEEGLWRDLRRTDGDGKQTILRITGKRNLEQARDVFYADPGKRAQVILSNADSVALLVTLLGRERFAARR